MEQWPRMIKKKAMIGEDKYRSKIMYGTHFVANAPYWQRVESLVQMGSYYSRL